MSAVVIDDIPPYTQATAILNQTVFGTNWTAEVASDVVVYQTPAGNAPDDATQILPYPSGYSVAFIGDQLQVQVTLVTPAAAGDIITITRMTPADRLNIYSNTNFTPSMLNNDFEILTLVDQQAQLVNQSIAPRYNYSAIIIPIIDTILPILGPDQIWVKNSAGTAIEAVDFPSAGFAPVDLTYFTATDESAFLVNSQQLVPGAGISFTITGRTTTISSPGGSVVSIIEGTGIIATPNPITGSGTIALNVAAMPAFTMAGNINMGGFKATNAADPLNPQDYATKSYVDMTALNGTSVYAASAATLGTVTQSGAGVGATLTNAGAQATFALDGVNPPVGVNVLIKDTATGMTSANEGIYTVTDVGSGATNWVLTRATSYDTPSEINNTGLIVIQNGSTLAGTAWYNSATIVTVDTTAFNFNEFGNIIFPISAAHGGTGLSSIAVHNLIVGNGASTVNLVAPSATVGVPLISQGASADPIYGTALVAGGGTGVTSVTISPTATAFAGWDANKNLSANSFLEGYTTTATAAGTTTLDVGSTYQQYFTGSTTQTVVLPVTSTLALGQSFYIVNNSSGVVTVQSSGANTVQAMAANTWALFTCILTSGTNAASWNVAYISSSGAFLPLSGGTLTGNLAFNPSTDGIVGTTTNNNTATGNVGEFISSVIAQGSPVSLSNATPNDITSISLTAGDWDVWGNVVINAAVAGGSGFYGWVSSTSATQPDLSLAAIQITPSAANAAWGMCVPQQRFSLSGTTTIYLSCEASTTGGSGLSGYGGIYARRVR